MDHVYAARNCSISFNYFNNGDQGAKMRFCGEHFYTLALTLSLLRKLSSAKYIVSSNFKYRPIFFKIG